MRKTIFPIVVQGGYDVLKYVYPIKQEYVQKLIENVMNIDDISYVILFGSSVSELCSDYSDIDVLILLNVDRESLEDRDYKYSIMEQVDEGIRSCPMDILVATVEQFRLEATTLNIYRQILEDGIIIYNKMWLVQEQQKIKDTLYKLFVDRSNVPPNIYDRMKGVDLIDDEGNIYRLD